MRSRVFVLLYLLSGAAALLYEVVWLRLLTMTFGHTTGAVGAVLAAFMGGLALGAWLTGRITPGLPPSRALRIYAALEVVVALCTIAMPFAIAAMRPLLAWAYADGAGGPVFGITRLAASIALIAIPGAAMGASFPIGVCVRTEGAPGAKGARSVIGAKRAKGAIGATGARDVGELYAANTIGAAVGAAPADSIEPTEPVLASSVLTAKNVKQLARPRRTRLQGGEHGIGTAKGRADSDGRRARATRVVGPSISHGAAPGAARADHSRVRRGSGQHGRGQAVADVANDGLEVARPVCARAPGRVVRRAAPRGTAADQR